MRHCTWYRQWNGLFRALLGSMASAYPARRDDKAYVVVDNFALHKAQAVKQWLAAQPRIELLFLPPSCAAANPIERIFGDTHDKVTRHHQPKRMRALVADVARHFCRNGPWRPQRGAIDDEPAVTAESRKLCNAVVKAAA